MGSEINMRIDSKTSYSGYVLKDLNSVYLLGIILTLLSWVSLDAVAQKDSLAEVPIDTSQIVPRYPSQAHLEELLDDRDYQYKDDPTPPKNPADKWFQWLYRKLRNLFRGPAYENFWQYAILATMAGLVFFLLYKAGILAYVFPDRERSGTTDYAIGQENINEINFDESISRALSDGDYRLAIRLQYLHTLKTLATKKLINWKPDRTNQSYIQELAQYPYQSDFVLITRYFEFAWYGDFQITKSGYEEMKEITGSFYTKLNPRNYD
jgi:hypothetical protein